MRAFCVATSLLLLTARAGEAVSPLVGSTRHQVLSRYGEPKSQIETGNRLILFYPRERIVLRDDVVVEVQPIAADAPVPAPVAPPQTSEANRDEAVTTGEGPVIPPVQAPAPEPKLEIKRVLTPSEQGSQRASRAAPQPEPDVKPPTPAPVVPTIVPAEVSTAPAENVLPEPGPDQNVAAQDANVTPEEDANVVPEEPPPPVRNETVEDLPTKAREELRVEAPPPPPPTPPVPEADTGVMSGRTYMMALVVAVSGIAFLFWRRRQRQSELEASSVENTPLGTSTAPAFTGNVFSADVLAKLDGRQFEELVAAYYSKTGVVAVRTKAGPDSPVHIEISWKGEPRPFAYVQCLSHPAGPIDVKPLKALVTALAADDIRRGYVVTTGKFNALARDLAEEKHLTLLPDDVFLEKLNALPGPARSEIMGSINGGEVSVPSCPKCGAKMVQSADSSPVWRCPNHPDETAPVRR